MVKPVGRRFGGCSAADALTLIRPTRLIAATIAQRDALREHKKGMMQQLFPSPAEADA